MLNYNSKVCPEFEQPGQMQAVVAILYKAWTQRIFPPKFVMFRNWKIIERRCWEGGCCFCVSLLTHKLPSRPWSFANYCLNLYSCPFVKVNIWCFSNDFENNNSFQNLITFQNNVNNLRIHWKYKGHNTAKRCENTDRIGVKKKKKKKKLRKLSESSITWVRLRWRHWDE